MIDLVSNIISSKSKISLDFTGQTIRDALNFGFSFIESEDHVVQFVIANGNILKKIFAEIPESILDPKKDSLGDLWTANLLYSSRLRNSQIVFSNSSFSAVINLNMDSNKEP
jgi:hypothetical protein